MKDGREATLYTLENAGLKVCISDYGAHIVSVFAPDASGNAKDVILGYDSVAGYEENPCFFGSVIGPNANRICGATFKIGDAGYDLAVNDGPNNLHSDYNTGFHKRLWDAQAEGGELKLSLEMKDGEMGFPGNLKVTLTYSITDDAGLKLHYHVTTDRPSLINMTNHAYFNLSGHNAGSIHDHLMKLNASYYTPVIDSAAIPTGEIVNVVGTPFDFIEEKTIGRDINADDAQLKAVGGYDHNFCIDGFDGTRRIFATVTSPVTGITMQCSTTLPGFQFYAGNFLKSSNAKGGGVYKSRDGFCLETQIYPNAVNEPEFPDPIFGPDREYDTVTVYQFA